MRSASTEQEAFDGGLGHGPTPVGNDGSGEEELIERHGSVKNVSSGQPESAFENGRWQNLFANDASLETWNQFSKELINIWIFISFCLNYWCSIQVNRLSKLCATVLSEVLQQYSSFEAKDG